MQWFAVVLVGCIGALLWLTPQLSRRTVPLGVSVPSGRIDDPLVRNGIRRFQRAVVAATIVTVAVVVSLWSYPQLTVSVAPILVLAGGVVAFVLCRRPIVAAKKEDRWYDSQQVRVQADIGAGGESVYRVHWLAWSAVVPLGVAVVTAVRYPSLPRRVPTHFGFAGEADQYSDKSVLTVFSLLFAVAGIGVLLAGLSFWTARASTRISPDGRSAQVARDTAGHRAAITARLLDQIGAVVMIGMSVMQVAIVLQWPAVVLGAAAVAVTTVPLVLIVLNLMTFQRVEPPTSDTFEGGPQSPDDDEHWKGGLLYINRDDPAFWVPKRSGIGETINLGHPGGRIACVIAAVVLVVLSVVGVALPLFLG